MTLCELSLAEFVDEFQEINSDAHPRRFCFVLGAGASISSGIRSGQQLVARWEKDLRERRGHKHEEWKASLGITPENQANFYSRYYEARFPNPKDGDAFLEKEMAKASPSIGYSALAYLLCQTNNNIVVTTNFDHLAEKAVELEHNILPKIIVHETLAKYISETDNRPTIIKIHRDLLMDPINTTEGIEKLKSDLEAPLDRVFANCHPVFIGYAGNDNSLMDYLIRNSDKVRTGAWKLPYWTLYGDGPLCGKAETFMTAAGGYVIRRCDFDELMVLLADELGFWLNRYDKTIEERRAINEKKLKALREKSASEFPERLKKAIDRIICEIDPSSRILRYREACAAHNNGDYAEAERIKRRLTEEDPDNAEYHCSLGVTLHAMKRYEEAEAEKRRAVELRPDKSRYRQQLCCTLQSLKRYMEAETEIRRALELKLKNAKYHSCLACTLKGQKRYVEAEAEYRRAVELEPDNAGYHYDLGWVLHQMKRYSDAEAEERQAVELRSSKAMYHEQYGSTLFSLKQFDKAEAEYRQALNLDPKCARCHVNFGRMLGKLKRYDEAEAEYRRAVELEQDNAKYHNILGGTLVDMKRYAEAEAEARRAVELEPDNAWYHNSLGATLHAMRRYEEAEAECRRALELDPDNAWYHNSLGGTLYAVKRYDEVEAEMRRALELEPDNADYHSCLGLTLRAMKRYEEALEAEVKAAELRKQQGT